MKITNFTKTNQIRKTLINSMRGFFSLSNVLIFNDQRQAKGVSKINSISYCWTGMSDLSVIQYFVLITIKLILQKLEKMTENRKNHRIKNNFPKIPIHLRKQTFPEILKNMIK